MDKETNYVVSKREHAKKSRAIRDYRCSFCKKKIPKGSEYYYRQDSIDNDGDWSKRRTRHLHLECLKFFPDPSLSK